LNIRVICGDDDCRKEFSADTEEPEWVCPECDRVIKNPHFPFLTARVMHSRFRPDQVDWEELLDRLLLDIAKHFEGKLSYLEDDEDGARVKEGLGESALLVREAADDLDALRKRYGERFGDDPQKMHDTLLEDAQRAATRLIELTTKTEEK